MNYLSFDKSKAGHSFRSFCKRSGSILWTVKDGVVWWCLSRHTETGELGDWGGGSKSTEDARAAMIREGIEESRGVFREVLLDSSAIDRSTVLVDGCNMAIFFIYVSPDFASRSVALFEEAKQSMHASSTSAASTTEKTELKGKKKASCYSCLEEVSELVWVDHPTFSNLVCGELTTDRSDRPKEILWIKIRGFIRKLVSLDDFRDLLIKKLEMENQSSQTNDSFRNFGSIEKYEEMKYDLHLEMQRDLQRDLQCPCEV